MVYDDCEQLNRYLSKRIRCDGTQFEPEDTLLAIRSSPDQAVKEAKAEIERLSFINKGRRLLVSNWFDFTNSGADVIVSMTYRVV